MADPRLESKTANTETAALADEISKEQQKKEDRARRLKANIAEFFSTEATYLQGMQELIDTLENHLAFLKKENQISGLEICDLQFFLEPYRKLIQLKTFAELEEEKEASIDPKIQLAKIYSAICGKSEPPEPNEKYRQCIAEAFYEASLNYNYFCLRLNALIEKTQDFASKSSIEVDQRFDYKYYERRAILPVQRGPRYKLLLEGIQGFCDQQDNKDLLDQIEPMLGITKKLLSEMNGQLKAAEARSANAEIEYQLKLLSPLRMQELIKSLDEYPSSLKDIESARSETILENLLKDLQASAQKPALSNAARTSEVQAKILMAYADIYVTERLENRGKHLAFLNELCERFSFLDRGAIEEKSPGPKKERVDARILGNRELSPETVEAVAKHLFNRAMVEGIAGNNEKIYVAARKAINRMGSVAISAWNSKAQAQLPGYQDDKNRLMIATESGLELEPKISKDFRALMREKPLRAAIGGSYSGQIMREIITAEISTLSQKDDEYLEWQKSQLKRLQKSLTSLIHTKRDPAAKASAFQMIILRLYLEAYVRENDAFKKEGQGEFLSRLGSIILRFTELTGNKLLFTGKDRKNPESSILACANTGLTLKDRRILVTQAFNRVKREVFGPLVADKEHKAITYINTIKAISCMGQSAIAEWNLLATQYTNPNLIIHAANQEERDIENSFRSINSKDPLQRANNHFASSPVTLFARPSLPEEQEKAKPSIQASPPRNKPNS